MVKLTLRLVDLSFCLPIKWMFADRNICVATQPGELYLRLLLQRGKFGLVKLEREAGLVVSRSGDNIAIDQRRISFVCDTVEFNLSLLCGNVLQHDQVVILHRLNRECDLVEIGSGVVQGDLELEGVDFEQD